MRYASYNMQKLRLHSHIRIPACLPSIGLSAGCSVSGAPKLLALITRTQVVDSYSTGQNAYS